ncbi:cupin domain-containing protein [Runella limosa]|uniref:cupin domain-containing protein n=1 Tax=Runella limosa TaxID=370978 RepID=UPI0012F74984|nr:hypothetical protein [Runella limosa]
MILIKKIDSFTRKTSPFCGEFFQILSGEEYQPDLVIFPDIRATDAHFHQDFDEIYLVIDGEIEVETYEPVGGIRLKTTLLPNELMMIGKGIHHKISKTSDTNRLCVISKPCYNSDDVHPSIYL